MEVQRRETSGCAGTPFDVFPVPLLASGTYIPRKEVVVLETIKATVIRENQAIRLRARKEGKDRGGVQRVTGNTPPPKPRH